MLHCVSHIIFGRRKKIAIILVVGQRLSSFLDKIVEDWLLLLFEKKCLFRRGFEK